MYWVQEYHAPGTNRLDHKMLNCDFQSDIQKLPTKEKEGVYQENDPAAYEKVKAGDQCLVLETGQVFEMGQELGWTEL